MTPAERLRYLRGKHTRTEYPVPCCCYCHQNWPCDTISAADSAVAAERERIITLLGRAAAGRREYAGPVADGSEARPLLPQSAMGYEEAARLIEDPSHLLSVIPAWRWTAEETAAVMPGGDPA